MAQAELDTFADAYGIKMALDFVPWSQSRNRDEPNPTLNFRVTLSKDKRQQIVFDYSMGCGHCKSKPTKPRSDSPYDRRHYDRELGRLRWLECEDGKPRTTSQTLVDSILRGTEYAKPSMADVLYAVATDSDVLNYACFEDWADCFGYDTDSRKGEKTYRACLEIALQLRAMIGEKGLSELSEAVTDY